MSDIDVVVPVLNGGPRFRSCLHALRDQRRVDMRVIVVDNGSSDGSLEAARSCPGVIVLSEPRRGSYAARNRGLREVTAPVVAFTDADCVPEPDWLSEGLRALERSGADLVGGDIAQEPGVGVVGRWDSLTYLNQRRAVEVLGVAMTANLFARSEAVRGIGGFDASMRSAGDWDLCRRAVSAGHQLVFAPSAVVRHAPREDLGAVVRRAWLIGRGQGDLAIRHRDLLPWALAPRRLAPGRLALRSRDPRIVLIDLLDRWLTGASRFARLATAIATRETRSHR